MEQLKSAALRAGINLFEFWDMTISEVQDVVEAYIEKKKNEDKQLKGIIYNNAYLTALFVGQMLGGKHIASFEDIFPDEKNENDTMTHQQMQDEILKEKLRDFAKKANQQRRRN